MTSRWQGRDAVLRDIRPRAGFKAGDFVKEKLGGGGATVERPLNLSPVVKRTRAISENLYLNSSLTGGA